MNYFVDTRLFSSLHKATAWDEYCRISDQSQNFFYKRKLFSKSWLLLNSENMVNIMNAPAAKQN